MLNRRDLMARRTIDMTTYGRKTGMPRRIEIWWFHVGGRFVITGTPGRRDWLANVRSEPRVIIHVDDHDIHARVEEISDLELRRRVFNHGQTRWYSTQAELDRLIASAPMIEVKLPEELQARGLDNA